MGSFLEMNDTLRITRDQGFPAYVLDLATHLVQPYHLDDLAERTFDFTGKDGIRIYHRPPVRNFLVEAIGDAWVYWGLCHILEVHHDYVEGTTSGRFTILSLNSPDDMRAAFTLIDANPDHAHPALPPLPPSSPGT